MITTNLKTLNDLLREHGQDSSLSAKKAVWRLKGLDTRLGKYAGTPNQVNALIKSLKNNPITPAPGWRIDPTNPNAVIRDTGYVQPVQPAPQVAPATSTINVASSQATAPPNLAELQKFSVGLSQGATTVPTALATGGTPAIDASKFLGVSPTPTATDIETQVTGSAAYKSFQDYLDKLTGIQTAQSEAEKAGLETQAAATTKTTEENLAARGLAFSGIRTQEIQNIASNLTASKLGVDRELATKLLNANQDLASYVTKQTEEIVKNITSDNAKTRSEAIDQINQAGYLVIGDQIVKKPEKEETLPTSYKEWQLAGGEDTGMSFNEWLNKGKTYEPPTSYQEWTLAGKPGTYAEFLERKTTEKPPTDAQKTLAGYATRMEQSEPTLKTLEPKIAKMNVISFEAQVRLPAAAQSAEMQQYMQAARNLINSVLRRESGAVISPTEFSEARKQYLPQPGDTIATLKLKENNRKVVFANYKKGAGNAYTPIEELLGGGSSASGITSSGIKWTIEE